MKAFICASTSLSALLLAASPAIADNRTTIQQIGPMLSATVDQTQATNATATITQGQDATSLGHSQVTLTQKGQGNTATLAQPVGTSTSLNAQGYASRFTVEQDGSNGIIQGVQQVHSEANLTQTATSGNDTLYDYQYGSGNVATTTQSGTYDKSAIGQGYAFAPDGSIPLLSLSAGSDTANVTQVASEDRSVIEQFSIGDGVTVYQGGANEVSTVTQGSTVNGGDGINLVSVTQTGQGDQSTVTQTTPLSGPPGSGFFFNTAEVSQSALKDISTITQYGYSNTATVSQASANATVTITQGVSASNAAANFSTATVHQ